MEPVSPRWGVELLLCHSGGCAGPGICSAWKGGGQGEAVSRRSPWITEGSGQGLGRGGV